MVDLDAAHDILRAQRVELPSWAFGNSGTRFKVFTQQGVPRDPFEKISDAAQVHRYTGVAPSVALHIPWDAGRGLRGAGAGTRGSRASSSARSTRTCFQDDDYRLGSVDEP